MLCPQPHRTAWSASASVPTKMVWTSTLPARHQSVNMGGKYMVEMGAPQRYRCDVRMLRRIGQEIHDQHVDIGLKRQVRQGFFGPEPRDEQCRYIRPGGKMRDGVSISDVDR